MAGFLDTLNNLSPEQSQGLLAAAAQMLQASGPSRTPTSFGQIFGSGLQAFQQGKQGAQDRAYETKLRDYKLKDIESDYANQEAARKRAKELADFYQQQGGPQSMAAPGSIGPTNANAARLGLGGATSTGGEALGGLGGLSPIALSAPAPYAPGPSSAGLQQIFQDKIALAKGLRSRGFAKEAADEEAAALKFQPEVKEWQKVKQDGRVLYAPYYKDGSIGNPVPLDVAEKLQEVNLGGTVQLRGEFSGAPMATLQRTISPDAALSAATSRRGQDLTNARAKDELAMGGKPPPGYRWTPEGTLAAIPGGPGDKLPESQQNQVVGVNNLSNAILEYRNELSKFSNLDAITPDGRARMGTKYKNVMLQAKEAYKLGVLNGPDKDILESIVTDPSSIKGMVTSRGALDTQASELDRIMQNIATVSSQVRQPQQSGARPAASGGKKISLADIAETARKSGRTTAEVTAAAKAKGYMIGSE